MEQFLFFHILGIIIPTDFHIFQRGRYTTNQPSMFKTTFAGCPFLTNTHMGMCPLVKFCNGQMLWMTIPERQYELPIPIVDDLLGDWHWLAEGRLTIRWNHRHLTNLITLLPSIKLTVCYGKSPCLIAKSSISMTHFPVRKLLVDWPVSRPWLGKSDARTTARTRKPSEKRWMRWKMSIPWFALQVWRCGVEMPPRIIGYHKELVEVVHPPQIEKRHGTPRSAENRFTSWLFVGDFFAATADPAVRYPRLGPCGLHGFLASCGSDGHWSWWVGAGGCGASDGTHGGTRWGWCRWKWVVKWPPHKLGYVATPITKSYI